jgi:uncharacterized membrane protein YbhN (UPF0104 family)
MAGVSPHNSAGIKLGIRRAVLGLVGLLLGALFLYLALQNINWQDVQALLQKLNLGWLGIAVGLYISAIGLRCVRWGFLLRVHDAVKWRHVMEALVAGFAANYLLPARIGELFRADYAMRLFRMSRFTSLGTIFVERVFDGVLLVCGLWISLGVLSLSGSAAIPPWALGAGLAASALFALALIFVLLSRGIDLRRFGVPNLLADRWDRMKEGISSVTRGQTGTIILCSLGIWMLEALALATIARAFGTILSTAQVVTLLGLGSLSTLIPTAPGFLGTYQFVFGQLFLLYGEPETTGVVVATAIQVFFFGSVTVAGIFFLFSRSGISVLRAMRLKVNNADGP